MSFKGCGRICTSRHVATRILRLVGDSVAMSRGRTCLFGCVELTNQCVAEVLSSLTHHRFDFGVRASESATESFVLLRFGVVHHRRSYLSVT